MKIKITKRQLRKGKPLNQITLAAYLIGEKSLKIGYRSYVLAIIGVLLAITPFAYEELKPVIKKREVTKIKTELSELRQDRKWNKMQSTLIDVREKFKGTDWCNFYIGVYRLNNPEAFRPFENAEYYFNLVPPNSEFYNESIILLTRSYFAIENKEKRYDKLDHLLKQLNDMNNSSPEYFMTKLFYLTQFPTENFKQKLLTEYKLLKSKYPDIFKHHSGQINFYSSKNEIVPIDLDKHSKIYGIALAYAFELYNKNGLTKEIGRDLLRMYPNSDSFGIAEMGMSNLHLNLEKANKGQFLKFKQWIISIKNTSTLKDNFTIVNTNVSSI